MKLFAVFGSLFPIQNLLCAQCLQLYIFAPVTDNRGWIMNETIDKRAGLVGKLHLDVGYFNQYKAYGKLYGQILQNVNAAP